MSRATRVGLVDEAWAQIEAVNTQAAARAIDIHIAVDWSRAPPR